MVDIDLKFDTTTNKPMYRQHGIGEFVNFSGGLDNAEMIVQADYSSATSYKFTKAYSIVVFSVTSARSLASVPIPSTPTLTRNGVSLSPITTVYTQSQASNGSGTIYGRTMCRTFILSDVKNGETLAIGHASSYCAFGQE